MAGTDLVTLRSGQVVSLPVVRQMLDLEADGFTFTADPDGRLRVRPVDRITPELSAFFRARRDAILAVVRACDQVTA